MLRLAAIITATLLTTAAQAEAKGPLSPKLITDETYTESFSAIADLKNGTYVHVQFGISNVGPGDGKGACRVVVAHSGKAYRDAEIVDRDEWTSEPTKLSIGPCTMTVTDKVTIIAPLKKARIKLVLFADPTKTLIPNAHAARYGDDFYDLDIMVPWTRVELTLEEDGKKQQSGGFGYMDHSRSKILPNKLAKSWVRFRSVRDERSRLALIRTADDGEVTGWIRDQGQPKVASVNRVQLKLAKGADGRAQAVKVMVDGDGGPWRIISSKLLHRSAPLEDNGLIGKIASTVVGNPVTYLFRAALEEKATRSRFEGILEITLTDE